VAPAESHGVVDAPTETNLSVLRTSSVTTTQAIRIWFLVLFSLGFAGTLVAFIRFRAQRGSVEAKFGPLPTPGPIVVSTAGVLILLTQTGEMLGEWAILRVLGVGLSLYTIFMLPWAVRTLGHYGIPGTAVLRDHVLITSGPFRLVRNPGYSAIMALWLGAALGTMNWLLLVLWPVLIAILSAVTREEERLLRAKFGASYEAYTARTGRFVPRFVRGRKAPGRTHDDETGPAG
jgi:protein-S-isoprenylcysteine O-methyltransferase Ste14